MTLIYTISEPATNEVVYVGKTTNLELRIKTHLQASHNSKLASWIKELSANGIIPKFTVVDNCEDDDSVFFEKKWIKFYKALGFKFFNANMIDEAKTTHQFQLSNQEFDKLYELAELPKQVSKSVALRTVIEKYSDLLISYKAMSAQLKELSNLK